MEQMHMGKAFHDNGETDEQRKQRDDEGEKEETVEKETVENIVSLNVEISSVVFLKIYSST